MYLITVVQSTLSRALVSDRLQDFLPPHRYLRLGTVVRTLREAREERPEVRHERHRRDAVHVVQQPDEAVAARLEGVRQVHALSDEDNAIDERVRIFEVAAVINWICVDVEDPVQGQRLRESYDFELL